MNPSLMNIYPINYSLSGDMKYTNRDRSYEYIERSSGMNPSMMDQQIGISSPTGMDFKYGSAQSHQQDGSCNTTNSQTVLTPPQSCDGSNISASVPSASSYVYSTQPKIPLSNASGLDFYPSATSNFLSSPFNGTNMTQTDRRPGSLQIRPISPPYGFGHSFPPFQNSRSDMSEYHPFTTHSQRNGSYNNFRGSRNGLPFAPFAPPIPPFGPSHSQQVQNRPEGPPFENIQIHHPLMNASHQTLNFEILASIPKGFFRVEDKWTCYRRNYFSVSCGFTFKSHRSDGPVFLQRYGHPEAVSAYAVSISARTAAANNSESESRGLVQHTPKRDKATESIPGRHVVSPTPTQHVNGNHSMAQSSLFSAPHLGGCITGGLDAFGHTNSQSPPTQHTFERIQFQKATANNGKRRAQQQYFHVVVRLEANVGQRGGADEWVLVASKQSHQMVVRGRSPGHYKDNRRDSQTSMDPDGGSGHSTDGPGPTGYALHPLGPSNSSIVGGGHGSYRHSHYYGTSFSHPTHRPEDNHSSSSTSPGSSTTLTSSPNGGGHCQMKYSMGRNILPEVHLERTVLSPILSRTEGEIMDYPRPQSVRRECDEDDSRHYCQPTTSYNPSFDFSATSSQTICA